MTAPDTTARDTTATARRPDPAERQRAVHGGVKVGAAFCGFVAAVGMVNVLGGLLGAVVVVLGLGGFGFLGFGTVEVVVLAVVTLAVSWLVGGYVAARMARFDGVRQGVAVWAWTVLLVGGLGVLAWGAGAGPWAGASGGLGVLTPAGGELAVGAVVLAAGPALVTLVAAVAGGALGMRYHRRVDRTETARPDHPVASAP